MAERDDDANAASLPIDIHAYNPWWNGDDVPEKSVTRADLSWRVKNALEHDVLLIPGPATTGTTTTLHQMVRVLIKGSAAEGGLGDRLSGLPADGFHPRQLCYVPCTDPVARLNSSFVQATNDMVSENALTVPAAVDTLFVFYDHAHRLTDWHTQFSTEYERLKPKDTNWTLVLTLPHQHLAEAHETAIASAEGTAGLSYDVDEPHLTQKFRDTLDRFSDVSLDRTSSEIPVRKSRDHLEAVATGTATADTLLDALGTLFQAVTDVYTDAELRAILDWHLVAGGFTSVMDDTDRPSLDQIVASSEPLPSPARRHTLRAHIREGIEQIIYQDIPSVMDADSDTTPRVADVNDVYSLITYLARTGVGERTYGDLETVLGVDDRTIRSKYIPLASNYHLLGKASRYNYERDRSLRFFFRSSAYVCALSDGFDFAERRSDLLYTALAEHLAREESPFDKPDPLAYWRGDAGMIDYVLRVDEYPVPIVRQTDTAETTPDTLFDAFRDADRVDTPPHLEIVVAQPGTDPSLTAVSADRYRLTLPDWLLLALC